MPIIQLCVVLLNLFIFTQTADRNATCTTPNSESAVCIALSDCPIIKNSIATYNKTAIEFAKQSQCGYDKEPLVCCGTTGYPTESSFLNIFTKTSPVTQPITPKTTPTTKSNIELTFISSGTLPDRSLCGLERETPRLKGAKIAGLDEYPWMALIRYKDEYGTDIGFKCGGTLINSKYILTAAHCVLTEPENIKAYSVRLGEWKISTETDCVQNLAIEDCADPVVDIEIAEEIPHAYYSSRSGNNDIALFRLANTVNYTNFIRPICLPPVNLPIPLPGTRMIVCGWGATENGSSSDVKLKLNVPVVANSDCMKTTSKLTTISANQICAGGEENKDACQGDSGGPLMRTYTDFTTQWYQEGVVSRGRGCGRKGYPGIYTRVSRYVNWIVNNLGD